MNNKNLIIIFVVVALLLIVISVSCWSYWQTRNTYSVVYLTTGEIYVGRLSYFPQLKLNDAYLIQVLQDSNDPNKTNFQLAPLSEAIWSPKTLYINKDQVVFSGPMNEYSKVVQTIKNKTEPKY